MSKPRKTASTTQEPAAIPDKFTVVRDRREQLGWTFPGCKDCFGTIDATLPTGDYSVLGLEEIITVERKGSTGEFAQNVCEPRFERELERLELFPHPFLICEFTFQDLQDFPKNSGIPPKYWRKLRVHSSFLIKKYCDYQLRYRTKIILAGTSAKSVTKAILKATWKVR